jgi:hypothetical protein
MERDDQLSTYRLSAISGPTLGKVVTPTGHGPMADEADSPADNISSDTEGMHGPACSYRLDDILCLV